MKLFTKQKYPQIYFQTNCEEYDPAEETPSPEELERTHLSYDEFRALAEKNEAMVLELAALEPKAPAYLDFSIADSPILSAAVTRESFSFTIHELNTFEFFLIANDLLCRGLCLDDLIVPVTFCFEGVRRIEGHRRASYFEIRPIKRVQTVLKHVRLCRYLTDAVLRCSPEETTIVFHLDGAQPGEPGLLLEVEARSFQIESDPRGQFIELFGAEHLDLFDAFWRQRLQKRLSAAKKKILLIRELRPEQPGEKRELEKHSYLRQAWKLEADDLYKKGRYEEALSKYQALAEALPDTGVYWKVGLTLYRLRRFKESMLYLYAALDGYHGFDSRQKTRMLLAQAWLRLGIRRNAEHQVTEILDEYPDYRPTLRFAKRHGLKIDLD